MSRAYPDRPLVGVGIVVLKPSAVLLIRRGRPPACGSWSLPGGAQKLGERVEAAARRELWEETRLRVASLEFVGHVDSVHHDDAGRVEYHYTILDFAASWTAGDPVAGGDAKEAAFVSFDALTQLGLWSETTRMIARAQAILAVG